MLLSAAIQSDSSREKPDNKAAKLGRVKCSQAIENSIAEDCFEVPDIEQIFRWGFSL